MSDLYEALDAAAQSILAAAMGEGNVAEGEAGFPVPLSERIRAFESVLKYADARSKAKPAAKQETKFDAVRSTFRGDTSKGGRRGTKAASEPAADEG